MSAYEVMIAAAAIERERQRREYQRQQIEAYTHVFHHFSGDDDRLAAEQQHQREVDGVEGGAQ